MGCRTPGFGIRVGNGGAEPPSRQGGSKRPFLAGPTCPARGKKYIKNRPKCYFAHILQKSGESAKKCWWKAGRNKWTFGGVLGTPKGGFEQVGRPQLSAIKGWGANSSDRNLVDSLDKYRRHPWQVPIKTRSRTREGVRRWRKMQ